MTLIRAAAYGRFSSDQQNPRSADDQLAQGRQLAARLGAVVVAEFKDEGLSGESDNRPGLKALMAAAARGDFDLVICESLDRLARTGGGTWNAFDDLTGLEIPIHTVEQGEIDELKTGVYALQTALFMKQHRAKVRRGQQANAQAGRHNAQPPYGYTRPRTALDARGEPIRGLLAIDAAKAPIVRRIVAEFLAGATPHAICRGLNAEGAPGPGGRPWTYLAISGRAAYADGILRNPIYAGELVWNRTRQTKDRRTGKTRIRRNPPELWVRTPAPHLAVVDADTWARVQARLAERARRVEAAGNASAANAPKRLLSGLVRCGSCGSAMHTMGPDRRYRCLARMSKGPTACTNARTAPAHLVEAQVMEDLRRDLLHPELIETFVREYHKAQQLRTAGARAARESIAQELAEARRRADRLVEQVADGHLAGHTVTAKLAQLEARAADLEAQLARLDASAEIVALHPHAARRYRLMVEDLQTALAEADRGAPEFARAQASLHKVIRSVAIHPLPERGRWRVELDGDLSALLGLAPDLPTSHRAAKA